MKRILPLILCSLALSVHCDTLTPSQQKAREVVLQQVKSCVLPVSEQVLQWDRDGYSFFTKKGKALVIASDGTAIIDSEWASGLYGGYGDYEDEIFCRLFSSTKVKIADGRLVSYHQAGKSYNPYCTIIKPDIPLSNQPYLDISKPKKAPLGLSVYVYHGDELNQPDLQVVTTTCDTTQDVKNSISGLSALAFSAQSGEFLGWARQVISHIYLTNEDFDPFKAFVEKYTDIKINQPEAYTKDNHAINSHYVAVYNRNRNSMGLLYFGDSSGDMKTQSFYILSPEGYILTSSFPVDKSSAKITAIFPDGSECSMKWLLNDTRKSQCAILCPVKPLKTPLSPVVWALGSQPQLNSDYYACIPGEVVKENLSGYDRHYPTRAVTHYYAPSILFDENGYAVALSALRSGTQLDEMLSVSESITFLKKSAPGIKLKTIEVSQADTRKPFFAKMWQDPRIWAWQTSSPIGGEYPPAMSASAICIDESGYFITTLGDYSPACYLLHYVQSPDEIRAAYQQTDDADYLRDETGYIGRIVPVYYDVNLGFTICKTLQPPSRPMKALDLTPSPSLPINEPLWAVDVSLLDTRVVPYIRPFVHQVIPYSEGYNPEKNDAGFIAVASDGAVRGYVTLRFVTPSAMMRSTVNLAEISKALAYVKEALGDK